MESFKKINTLVFDVDGVLTDGTLWVMPGKHMVRRMNIKDGYALQLAVKKGYTIIIISGGNSPDVKERLESLGVKLVYMKVENKLQALSGILPSLSTRFSEVLFMGDDIPDLEVMQSVAVACCPADAVQEIKEISHYVSPYKGGNGCVRDVIEKVLKAQDNWSPDTHIPSK